MSYESLLIHTVTIFNRTASTTDPRYGDEIENFDGGTTSNARVEPNAANEDIIDRETRINTYTVFLPITATISALSRLTWDGHTLRVDGEPKVYSDGVGPHHIEAVCEEVLG